MNYYIDATAASIAATIRTAAAEWTAVDTAYINLVETVDATQAQITFSVGASSHGGEAGYTLTSDGYFASCTAMIASSTLSAANWVVEATALHEGGHCLGLAHSVAANAIMSYRYGPSLTDDDKLAVTLLYPGGSSPTYPMGCAAVAAPGARLRGAVSLIFEVVLALAVLIAL